MTDNEIIKCLEKCDFCELCSSNYEDNILYYLNEAGCSYQSFYGGTKLVLLFNQTDFVIKIPFEGELDYDYDDEEEIFRPFYAEGNGWDYCAMEEDEYQRACEFGIEQCFAKTSYFCTIDGHPIYKQPYVRMYSIHQEGSTHSEADSREAERRYKESDGVSGGLPSEWMADVVSYFGGETFSKLLKFLSRSDINDLHSGNVGYLNNAPVLVDYSGYFE